MPDIDPNSSRMLRLVQISDCHLHAGPRERLAGMDTRHSLLQVLKQIRQDLPSDFLLATGDLAHDAAPQSYQWLNRQLHQMACPSYCLPGNHDDPDNMRRHLQGGGVTVCDKLEIGSWLLLFLDSTLPGSTTGHLGTAQKRQLEQTLRLHTEPNVLVCLHHQPVPIGSVWMDRMAVDDPASLFDVIDSDTRIRGILWGHIHQTFDALRGEVRLMGSPSTCVQFTPGKTEFSIDTMPPGYRWLELYPNGEIRTGVLRLAHLPGDLDIRSGGY